MSSKYFKKALAQTSKASRIFIAKNLDIAEQVYEILDRQGKTQKDLARALEKAESEISRMLSGSQNLTLKTLARMEEALGEDIIMTSLKAQEKFSQWKTTPEAKVVSFHHRSTVVQVNKKEPIKALSKKKINLASTVTFTWRAEAL